MKKTINIDQFLSSTTTRAEPVPAFLSVRQIMNRKDSNDLHRTSALSSQRSGRARSQSIPAILRPVAPKKKPGRHTRIKSFVPLQFRQQASQKIITPQKTQPSSRKDPTPRHTPHKKLESNLKFLGSIQKPFLLQTQGAQTLSKIAAYHNAPYTSTQFPHSKISCLVIDNNFQYLFIGESSGTLTQIRTSNNTIAKAYGKILEGRICLLQISKDNESIFAADEFGNMRQFGIKLKKIVQDYPKVFKYEIGCMAVTQNSEYLLVSDKKGSLKQFDIKNFSLYRHPQKLKKSYIVAMAASPDGSCYFTSDTLGHTKQFLLGSGVLVKDYKKVFCGGKGKVG
jgi:hypothetical protein